MAILNGTGSSETIKGTSSADTIYGKAGDDSIYGLAGNDILYGNYGNDTLLGGGGRDILIGGLGADTFKYLRFDDSSANPDLIRDFQGSEGSAGLVGDVVDLRALGKAMLEAKYYPDYSGLQAVFSYNSVSNLTTLSYYQGSSTPVFQVKFTGYVAYDDPYWNGSGQDPNFLGIKVSTSPTAGDDYLSGTGINALGGNDIIFSAGTVHGGAGDDDIFGNNGTLDAIYGQAGNDYIYADPSDNVFGGGGDDSIDLLFASGGTGVGHIEGGDGYDTLLRVGVPGDVVDAANGTAGAFTFDGIERFEGAFTTFIGTDISETVYIQDWAGDGIFVGNGGDDYATVSAGSNRFIGGPGNDTLDNFWGGGDDTAVFSGKSTDYIITVSDPFAYKTTVQQIGGGGDGTDTLQYVAYLEFADGTFKVTDFFVTSGPPTEGDDWRTGTEGSDTIDLLGGDDTYDGLGGHDSVAGGAGNDTLYGRGGNDNIRGGSGFDQLLGGEGNDILYGGTEKDLLFGGLGFDTLYGGDGNDALVDGDFDENDAYQDDADDFLYGQLGNDTFYAREGNDYLNGGGGYDTANYTQFSEFTVEKNVDGTVTVTDVSATNYEYGIDTLVGIEAIEFEDGVYIVATNTFTPFDFVI